mmetsp:Transcript_31225/g.61643  ORF Transcript_31225/g.61643 Transcript_31225/m.61643 type:complete len:215 (-) Transcript_31225:23-667(-)
MEGKVGVRRMEGREDLSDEVTLSLWAARPLLVLFQRHKRFFIFCRTEWVEGVESEVKSGGVGGWLLFVTTFVAWGVSSVLLSFRASLLARLSACLPVDLIRFFCSVLVFRSRLLGWRQRILYTLTHAHRPSLCLYHRKRLSLSASCRFRLSISLSLSLSLSLLSALSCFDQKGEEGSKKQREEACSLEEQAKELNFNPKFVFCCGSAIECCRSV